MSYYLEHLTQDITEQERKHDCRAVLSYDLGVDNTMQTAFGAPKAPPLLFSEIGFWMDSCSYIYIYNICQDGGAVGFR